MNTRNFLTSYLLFSTFSLCSGTTFGFSMMPTAGLFSNIKVAEREFPATRIGYKTYTSAYKDSGKYIDDAKKAASGFPNHSTVGLFLDDPNSVPSGKTRYAIGVTVGEDETELEDRLKAGGYKMYDLPKTPAIHTTFPETSLISTVVGKLRVYPKLEEFAKRIGKPAGPFAEVSKNGEKETNFYGMLDNREVFMLGLEDPEQYAAKANRR